MKIAIPWLLAVVLLAGVCFLYSANNEKTAQFTARMDQMSGDLEKLRAENEELKKGTVDKEELAQLRKDSMDLLHVRSELQQLRSQNQKAAADLAAAARQGSQAQAAQEKLASENAALRDQTQKLAQAQAQATHVPLQETVTACINNLRIIDAAKQQWALANNKPADAIPTEADIAPYLPANTQIVCPAGGTYSINAVGVAPTCTIPGHVLSKQP